MNAVGISDETLSKSNELSKPNYNDRSGAAEDKSEDTLVLSPYDDTLMDNAT